MAPPGRRPCVPSSRSRANGPIVMGGAGNMSRWLRLTRLAVIATVALSSPAFSDVLDQNQPTPIGGMWRMAARDGNGLMGATFTAGISGILSRLELGLA